MVFAQHWPIHDLLTERAATSPDRIAVIDTETQREWTFTDLESSVGELAGRLTATGIESGDHLGILLDTSLASVRVLHAAMRLGVVLVPLNTRLTDKELAEQTATADIDTVVCTARTADTAETLPAVSICSMDQADQTSIPSLQQQTPVHVSPRAMDPDDPCLLIFTSGTTGAPKPVQLTARNLVMSAIASGFRLGVSPTDRWLVCLPLYHLGGLAPVIRTTLYGTTCVVQREFRAEETASLMDRLSITGISLVPTLLTRLLAEDWHPPEALRFVLLGGAPASEDLISQCELYDIPVFPTYGTTETASQIATARPNEAYNNPDTVGRPLLYTSVSVRKDGTTCQTDEVGELVVSGPTVSPGYYENEQATAAAYDEHGFYTGDIGFRDGDGYLYVIGRQDDMIITGGEKVHPREVSEILESHPDVLEAAVVGLEDEEWGEQIAALVVRAASGAREGTDVGSEELKAFCRRNLADFKCPRTIQIVSSIPRTASGTVDRAAVKGKLRKQA